GCRQKEGGAEHRPTPRQSQREGATGRHLPAPDARPSAVTMTRNTRVLSMWPRNSSAPGPMAVKMTSSPAWTPWDASNGGLPAPPPAPDTLQYLSLGTNVSLLAPATAGTFSPSRYGLPVSQ